MSDFYTREYLLERGILGESAIVKRILDQVLEKADLGFTTATFGGLVNPTRIAERLRANFAEDVKILVLGNSIRIDWHSDEDRESHSKASCVTNVHK